MPKKILALDSTDEVTVPSDVHNSTITFTQGGVEKGSFNLNQESNQTIALDAGGGLIGFSVYFPPIAQMQSVIEYGEGHICLLKSDGSVQTLSLDSSLASMTVSNVIALNAQFNNSQGGNPWIGTFNYTMNSTNGVYYSWPTMTFPAYSHTIYSHGTMILTGDMVITSIDCDTCLDGSTLVTMADRSERRIDSLHAGDKVLAYDANTNELVADELVFSDADEIKTFNRKDIWKFENGYSVETIHDHELYNVEKGGMKYMKDWQIGDHAVTLDGQEVALVSHEVEEGEFRHFKITGHHHNFFVNGLLNGDRHSMVCLNRRAK